MYPEDRVLIGVINRKRDLQCLLEHQWYRIPYGQMPEGVNAEVLGFFLSGTACHGLESSGIYYYAVLRGIELVRRRDLLPKEVRHSRANHLYYKCQVGEVHLCRPPILNRERRTIAFIATTWDRFADALTIADLYRDGAYYVKRVYSPKSKKSLFL